MVKKLKYRNVYEEGISVSWLQRFINCRERFRLGYVMGYREKGSKDALDFGTIFHKLIEEHSRNPKRTNFTPYLSKWLKVKFAKSSPAHRSNIITLGKIALIVFHEYIKYHDDSNTQYFAQEQVFCEPYTLNSGRTLLLRGRMDEIIQAPQGLILQENKTHANFNKEHVVAKLPKNLQTMFYCTAIQLLHGVTPRGVLYNIARRPGLIQGKKETETAYLKRIEADIQKRPDWYFFRHQHAPSTFPHELEQWQLRTLNPNLEAVCEWWESIRGNPTNPWVTPDGRANPHHYERPFGVYDPMTLGNGEFYDLIVRNSKVGIGVVDDIFPELQDD